jgi:hypothetical protein
MSGVMGIINMMVIVYYKIFRWGGRDLACFYYEQTFSGIGIFVLIEVMEHVIPHILPCALIFILSVLIIIGLLRARIETKSLTKSVRNDHSNLVSLLLVCLLYIISTVPYLTIWSYSNYFNYIVGEWPGRSEDEVKVFLMIGYFATSFAMMNYSFNFLIYACTLKIYKETLRAMIRQCFGNRRKV